MKPILHLALNLYFIVGVIELYQWDCEWPRHGRGWSLWADRATWTIGLTFWLPIGISYWMKDKVTRHSEHRHS